MASGHAAALVRNRRQHDRTRGRETGAADPLSSRIALPAVAAVALLTGATTFRAARYFDNGPPPAHTGAFGEPTCRVCHAGADTADDPHVLVVSGVPETWRPDSVYAIRLTIRALGTAVGGFQMSTRFLGGSQHGRQAGTLASVDERVAMNPMGPAGVSYAQHARASEPSADSSISWTVRWSAPRSGGDVAVDVAVNAGNGDASPFGDRIFNRRIVIGAADSSSRTRRSPSNGLKRR